MFKDFLFPTSLQVAGMLHVFHNALGDVFKVMKQFPWFKAAVKSVAKVFHRISHRDTFVERCLKNTIYEDSKKFEKLCPEFIAWRWGSLVDVCRYLYEREPEIRACWKDRQMKINREHKRTVGEDQDNASDDEYKIDMKHVGVTIRDLNFWSYMNMILVMNYIPQRLFSWFQRCPCHERMYQQMQAENRGMTMKEITKKALGDLLSAGEAVFGIVCPCCGMWLPELVMGDHLVLMERLCSGRRQLLRVELLQGRKGRPSY